MILKASTYCSKHQHLHRGGDGWSECNKLYLEIFKFLSSGKIFELRYFSDKGESLIDFRTQCVIMTQRIDSLQKAFLNVFRIKKANCIFEELSYLYLVVLQICFFPLFCGLLSKTEPIWRNYKIRRNTTPQTYKFHLTIHQQLQ